MTLARHSLIDLSAPFLPRLPETALPPGGPSNSDTIQSFAETPPVQTLQIVILSLVQGLTEFLPISSSAHLILAPRVLGYADQGLAFDVALHLGTLGAVVLYFRHEIGRILRDWFLTLAPKRPLTPDARMGWLIILATLPAGLAGLAFKHLVETELRSSLVIAATTIGFGALLWWFDVRGRRTRSEATLSVWDALVIGLFQALALIPGTSRSGATMTAGLMLGLTREAAARFSFLMSIPVIFLSGTLVIHDLIAAGTDVHWGELAVGAGLSFATALLCIHYFLRFIEGVGMWPFVLYRLFLGVAILGVVL